MATAPHAQPATAFAAPDAAAHPTGPPAGDSHRHGEYVLTLDCPDRIGVVHSVADYLLRHRAYITQSQQFTDEHRGRFFMRIQFRVPQFGPGRKELEQGMAWVGEAFAMHWRLHDATTPTRALIMVSKPQHCLNDLLFRAHTGMLDLDVSLVVSNHPDAAALTRSYGVEFRHVPVPAEGKAEAEAELIRLVDERGIGLVVLARYMQVLSDDLCKRLEGRAINIHHSFLPSFKGARPYQQAHDRGVKLIGATAHYVTEELDEGPIIEQDVARVDHAMDPGRLAAIGRDVECQVLARAVRWHSEHRILLNGNRTIVFE